MSADGAWCVCRPDVADAALQKTLDYACGHGADCAAVLPTGPCYSPTSVRAHCSYAANSYFQRNSGQANGATCDFGGTANLTDTDPSTYSTRPPLFALDRRRQTPASVMTVSSSILLLTSVAGCRLWNLQIPCNSKVRRMHSGQTMFAGETNTLLIESVVRARAAKQGQAATQPARARRRQALRVTRLRRPAREGASRHLSAHLAPRRAPSARAPPPPPRFLVAMPSSSPSSPSPCVSWCANLVDQKESEAGPLSV